MPRDYYEVLGVSRTATDDEIKRAHRKLAREHHPDRNPGDKSAETRFKEVEEAYDVLSDKTKRSQYDQFGSVGAQGGPNGAPGGFHWGGGFGEGVEIDPSQIDEMLRRAGFGGMGDFGQRGRHGGRSRRAQPREPVSHELRVPFETAALGGTISLSVDGRNIDVKIPAGMEEGKSLRVQGQGPGGADLLLRIAIDPHRFFRREGNDLIITAPITVAEAILGAKIDVPTLDGARLTVKIPPGTSSGGRLRLRGKGIKGGDQFVEIKIVAPAGIDDESRKLIESFAQRNHQNPRSGVPWE
ncbi:MAG: J domain-containing protein [Planctomycetes bacterium]|nr:J domain-containing protein [Planctomycetota bacterium]